MIGLLLIVLCALLIVAWLGAPRVVPWADQLVRLNPGAGAGAEWMAPDYVLERVASDYGAGQKWMRARAAHWGPFGEGLDYYAAGAHLRTLRRALAALAQHREPRVASRLSAAHEISVRRFSADGLRCLLIDRQTSRTLTTFHYWSGRAVHRQRLDDAALVYQMGFDQDDRRWKIERLVQELPLGWGPGREARVRLSAELPQPAGRDS